MSYSTLYLGLGSVDIFKYILHQVTNTVQQVYLMFFKKVINDNLLIFIFIHL